MLRSRMLWVPFTAVVPSEPLRMSVRRPRVASASSMRIVLPVSTSSVVRLTLLPESRLNEPTIDLMPAASVAVL
ncbi:hypothetical protein D9M69_715730 [compost metagenome]